MAQVVLENVYKSFFESKVIQEPEAEKGNDSLASTPVLRRINLTVEDGEFMVLVGPSGCGKSTLLRLIAGLEELTGGNIWVGERLVNDLPPKERDIAMVFQNYALYPHMTVYDNIAFGLRRMKGAGEQGSRGAGEQFSRLKEDFLVRITKSFPKELRYLSPKEKLVQKQVKNVAQLLQIESLLSRLPKQLSGGQKQRVALGRAIARNPQVFLMDEPLSNLDAKLRAETRAQIVKLQRQLGTTTIYVTHDQTEAMTMGDRIAVMNQGQLQQLAKPLELYNSPANMFVAQFIGSPPMNFIPVQFQAPLLINHPQFRLNLPEVWESALRKYDRQSLILGIRPEHFSLSVPALENLQVEVDLVEALGNETYLSVHLLDETNANFTLQVRVPPEKQVSIGDKISLALESKKIHLFDPETNLAIFPIN
ncbi:ABC transporter ATP-binding protein [Floridanema evergladense]|uniref:ABC transporter ATP-binding protein n=1 Tax=Floridaenema evergladense BLCC-F167 TaxID=3153639 RepID=A0ABV4WIC3_9CYAN